ncbi:MAG: nitroreductase family deazaflavin-dependent oxidoreductase [Nitrososphaerota archaeon]|nr:nitroreductase family deazaflavin-dependent oxidoreductase [Nitrososphaerota archaeon]
MDPAGQYVRLETVGRRSGRLHSVIVRYVMYDGKLVVFPEKEGHQDWVANLKGNPSVGVYAGEARWEGKAEPRRAVGLRDPVLGAFTRKYGVAEVRKRHWGQTEFFQISLLSMTAEDHAELVYSDLEAAFDGVALAYDRHIFGNPMNVWLRDRSVDLLSELFKPGDTIIDVGCGTGTETLRLASMGIRVVATDISQKMIEVLTKKAKARGLEKNIIPVHCRAHQLREGLAKVGYTRVDGAYSTYGAVNTEPRLEEMMANLHELIRPGGRLVLGVWNKFCLYELIGYSMRMRPSMVVARLRNPVPVGKSRFCVATNAFSVGDLSRQIHGWFGLESVRGVCILLPPSNLTRYLPKGRLLQLFKGLDVSLQSKNPWCRLGDHFLGVYSRIG